MRFIFVCLLFICNFLCADTIDHFMSIANNIPKMEMKADPQAQAWARSARNVLIITSESIAETISEANAEAKKQGSPVFCLPSNIKLSATLLTNLIQQTYKELSSQTADKNKMTVSQIAWMGVKKTYPCKQLTPHNKQMEHMSALFVH